MHQVQIGNIPHSAVKLCTTKMLLVSSAKIWKCCLVFYVVKKASLLHLMLLYFVVILSICALR